MTTNPFSELHPTAVWRRFHEITQIPRPSGKEDQIRNHLIKFAQDHNLEYKSDLAGNLIIYKAASSDTTTSTVILQAHMDMVCEKSTTSQHNFSLDPIKAFADQDWIKTEDTTLGADNGIGIALILAVLESDSIAHPRLECLFTSDEESGLTGAKALDTKLLTGQMLINLDSEDDGEIFVGCAGGIDTTAQLPITSNTPPNDIFGFKVSINGLLGGHSGDDINKGRANAIKTIGAFLHSLALQTTVLIHSINGGNLRNAIPRDAFAVGYIPFKDKEKLRIVFNIFLSEMEERFEGKESFKMLELETGMDVLSTFTHEESAAMIGSINDCPSGVVSMSKIYPDFVETSTNLAFIRTDDEKITIATSQRSSSEESKMKIAEQTSTIFKSHGAKVTQGNEYPGWTPTKNSSLLHIAQQSYIKLYAEDPKVKIVHAGLECGLFALQMPYLDMISIGPTIRDGHSPSEKLSISSTQKTWMWLQQILACIN